MFLEAQKRLSFINTIKEEVDLVEVFHKPITVEIMWHILASDTSKNKLLNTCKILLTVVLRRS